MERHFTLAFTIAVAVHGLLLGIPRGPVPPHDPARRTGAATGCPPAILLDDASPRDPADKGAGPADAAEAVARLPDRPVVDDATLFRMPVEIDAPNRVGLEPAYRIPNDLIGGGGDGNGRGGPVVIGERFLDHTPRARVRVAPDYPPTARREGRTATVTVEFVVDETGAVVAPRAISSGDADFEAAAVRAVGRWRFEPGTVNGRTVRFRMAVPIVFRLGELE